MRGLVPLLLLIYLPLAARSAVDLAHEIRQNGFDRERCYYVVSRSGDVRPVRSDTEAVPPTVTQYREMEYITSPCFSVNLFHMKTLQGEPHSVDLRGVPGWHATEAVTC